LRNKEQFHEQTTAINYDSKWSIYFAVWKKLRQR